MNANEIINDWNAKTAENQQAFCRNCVLKAIRQGRKLKHGNDVEDAMQSTFAAVLERLADLDSLEATCKRMKSQGRTETLASLIMRCAKATLQREIDREKRESVFVDNVISTKEGEERDVFDTISSKTDTEKAAITRATLKDFYNGLDSKNKTIFGGMVQGKTEREIAPAVGISHVATHNRMVKIRAQLAALL